MRISLLEKAGLIAAFLLFVLTGSSALAQQESAGDTPADDAHVDTVFQEIRLSDEGVTAVDTAGDDWYYDFAAGTFVTGVLRDGSEQRGPEGRDESGDYVAIEERCTEEISFKPLVASALVGYDEFVDDDIIAYGRVTVKGWVKGDVTSIGKRVLVASSGRVDGDIAAPEIIVKEGGIVRGEQIIADWPTGGGASFFPDGMIVVVSFTAFFIFLGFLVVTLMPRQLGHIRECLSKNKVKAYFIGLFFIVAMPVVILLVGITIVGLVLLPFIPFVYLFAIVLGIVSFGDQLGRLLSKTAFGGERSLLFQSRMGILLIMGPWFVTATLLGTTNEVAEGFGVFFLVISIIFGSYPVCVGVGTAAMTRFGFRPHTSWRERQQQTGIGPAPAPPPIPKAPPEPSPSAFGDETDETSASD